MRNVLVVGPWFHGYVEQISNAFITNGCGSAHITYDDSFFNTNARRVKKLLKIDVPDGFNLQLNHYRRSILDYCKRLKPELTVVIRPDYLLPETLEDMHHVNRNGKIVFWLTDPVSRFPIDQGYFKHVERTFFYNLDDLNFFLENSISSVYLPMGFDNTIFPAPLRHPTLTRDVVFIGNVSPERFSDLKSIAEYFDLDRGAMFIGSGYRNPLSRIGRKIFCAETVLDKYASNRNVSPEQANLLYKSSRASLNIQQPGSGRGYNPRLFEISGAGGFQIVKNIPGVEEIFVPNKEIVVYESTDELTSLLKFYLTHDDARNKIAAAASDKAHAMHTFVHRTRSILSHLDMLP